MWAAEINVSAAEMVGRGQTKNPRNPLIALDPKGSSASVGIAASIICGSR
jgi:hypothetical protein